MATATQMIEVELVRTLGEPLPHRARGLRTALGYALMRRLRCAARRALDLRTELQVIEPAAPATDAEGIAAHWPQRADGLRARACCAVMRPVRRAVSSLLDMRTEIEVLD